MVFCLEYLLFSLLNAIFYTKVIYLLQVFSLFYSLIMKEFSYYKKTQFVFLDNVYFFQFSRTKLAKSLFVFHDKKGGLTFLSDIYYAKQLLSNCYLHGCGICL